MAAAASGPLGEAVVNQWLSVSASAHGNVRSAATYDWQAGEAYHKADLITLDRTPKHQWSARQKDLAYGRSLGAAGFGEGLPALAEAMLGLFLPGLAPRMQQWEDITRPGARMPNYLVEGMTVNEFADELSSSSGKSWVRGAEGDWVLQVDTSRSWSIYNEANSWTKGATAELQVLSERGRKISLVKYRFDDYDYYIPKQ